MDSKKAKLEDYCEFLEVGFIEFQEKMEELGVGDLTLDAGRALQVAVRYLNELERDKTEHDVAHLSDARTAAIWSLEIMRASPILAPYKPDAPDDQKIIRARINAEFAFFYATTWMKIEIPDKRISQRTFDLTMDALQFRSGCRHTLAIAYSMMVDYEKK